MTSLVIFKSESVTARAFSWIHSCPRAAQQLECDWEWSGMMTVEAMWLWRMILACPGSPWSQKGFGWFRAVDRGHNGWGGGPPLWSQTPGLSSREGMSVQWGHDHQRLQAPWRTRPCSRIESHLDLVGLADPQGLFRAHSAVTRMMDDLLGCRGNFFLHRSLLYLKRLFAHITTKHSIKKAFYVMY